MFLRRFTLITALAVTLPTVFAPGAHAARGTAADNSYLYCSEQPGQLYRVVAGAPIAASSQAQLGDSGAPTTTIPCSDNGEAPGTSPWYPTGEGVYAQAWAGSAQGPVYAVVGGSLLPAGTAPANIERFDKASSPGADGAEQAGVYGMFSSIVRNGYFRNPTGAYFRTDYAGHPVILPKAPVGHVAAVVAQTSIDACERMNCDPWGDISVAAAGEGLLRVSGYALDAFASQPLTVHFDAAGQPIDIVANQPAPDINAGYGIAGNYGFDKVIAVPAGHYDLCTTFVGYAPGGTATPAGCQVVDVPGAKPGKVHRPKVKALGHGTVLVRWKVPATHGSPISEYLVKVSGSKKKQVSGARHKIVLKHLRPGRTVSVKVRAINGVGIGPNSKASKTVRVR